MRIDPVTKQIKLTAEEKAAYSFIWATKPDSPIPFDEILAELEGSVLKFRITEGKIQFGSTTYLISWLSTPEMCFRSKRVLLKLRNVDSSCSEYHRALVMAADNRHGYFPDSK